MSAVALEPFPQSVTEVKQNCCLFGMTMGGSRNGLLEDLYRVIEVRSYARPLEPGCPGVPGPDLQFARQVGQRRGALGVTRGCRVYRGPADLDRCLQVR